ncbi:LamG-like jellyroll fold domain-containing protein [Sedimentisphaera salicampi]|uniref:LamG-like jellyroll fold domain-containing protein n=1 Tax=Sedimentisphaera salicampi TaxID=1941349 RepID=UPI000B9A993E|nr:LamG-like jellyroll fold domain-containing protein [Sedimentisphaera salicampi]OXU15412.1 Immunoglobulin V-set domain protein [Sedimentisphaera salicampi]
MKRYIILMMALMLALPAFAATGTFDATKNADLSTLVSTEGAFERAHNMGVLNEGAEIPQMGYISGVPFTVNDENVTLVEPIDYSLPNPNPAQTGYALNVAKSGYQGWKDFRFASEDIDGLEIGAQYRLEVYYMYHWSWDCKTGLTITLPSTGDQYQKREHSNGGQTYLAEQGFVWTTEAADDTNSDGYAEISFQFSGHLGRSHDQDRGHLIGYQIRRIDQNVAGIVSPARDADLVPTDTELHWISTEDNVESYNVYYVDASLSTTNEPNIIDLEGTMENVAYTDGNESLTPASSFDNDTRYFWRVDQVLTGGDVIKGDVWTFTTTPLSPVITDQPDNTTVNPYETATFSVAGDNTTGYQWYKYIEEGEDQMLVDGARFSGTDTSELTISDVIYSDEAQYYCVLTGLAEPPAQTNNASLTVNIDTQGYTSVAEGETGIIETTELDGASYQWFKYVDGVSDIALTDGADYAGTQTYQLSVLDFSTADEAEYYCVITDAVHSSKASGNSELDMKELLAHYKLEADGTDETGSYPLAAEGGDPNSFERFAGNNALHFNGSNYLDNQFASEQTFQNFSVSIWAKTSEVDQPGWTGFFNNDSSSDDFQLECDQGTWEYNGVGGTFVLADVYPDEWIHIVMCCDGSGTDFYVNGVYEGRSGSAANNFGSISVGSNRSRGNLFTGDIDEVKLFNYVLSNEEVIDLTNYDPDANVVECLDRPEFDITGPEGVPDCKQDIYDLRLLMVEWMENNIYPQS